MIAIFVAVTFAAGCFANGSSTDEPTAETTTDTEVETTAGETEPATESTAPAEESNAPPDSTLSYAGRSVMGGLGSFCWGPNRLCVSGPGVSIPKKRHTLVIPTGSTLEFDFGGKEHLTSIAARAYPLDRGNVVSEIGGGRVLSPAEGRSDLVSEDLQVHRQGGNFLIPIDLPAGEYVVEIFVKVPKRDATYFFRVLAQR